MHESERPFSHLVVIGASAGGVESLSVLVSMLPSPFPGPIVVAQHVSPTRASALGEILARRSVLPVRTVIDREALESGVIYIVPPNRNVEIGNRDVRVRQDGQGPHPSIDLLFSSAAKVFGEQVIAVVLSGTGSDGAAGAREVSHAGGTVIIENPDTASYPGMPLSLASSVVDIVANRERIAEILTKLVDETSVVAPPAEQSQLRLFLEELREGSGIDFTTYKQGTIERRVQRRMAATGQPALSDYIRYVRQHPEERQRLVASFLIKVTEFLRDPDLYGYLREQVLPELIREARERGGELRMWSAGCATGEEAYSLAMTVLDVLAVEGGGVTARIFATDLDGEAVAFARRGIYPARALAHVPPDLVDRYFVRSGEDYEVRKSLRTILVFGEHDLAQRAPFPRIDLILCRNVLIYFTPALQRRALQLFAFSLRSGGYLVLGKSETVSPLAEFFTADQPRLKVYRRVGERALIPPARIHDAVPTMSPHGAAARTPTTVSSTRLSREELHPRPVRLGEQALLSVPFGVVVVDRRYDIQFINGEARRAFGIHSSALEQDLIHLIQHVDPVAVRKVIDEANETGAPVTRLLTSPDLPLEMQRALEITCTVISHGDSDLDSLTVVATIDVTEREQLRRRQEGAEETFARLSRANDEVMEANQELALTISRLRAENEELLVASEEIQAATEEVETLNEELQASNEELETLNEELQATVEELNTTNDDLEARTIELQAMAIEAEASRQQLRAILDAVESAVVVVDNTSSVVLRNEAYAALFPETGDPVPLLDQHGDRLPDDARPIERAARGETFTFIFALNRGSGSEWYMVTGRQVSSERDGRRLGVVTIRQVTPPG